MQLLENADVLQILQNHAPHFIFSPEKLSLITDALNQKLAEKALKEKIEPAPKKEHWQP